MATTEEQRPQIIEIRTLRVLTSIRNAAWSGVGLLAVLAAIGVAILVR